MTPQTSAVTVLGLGPMGQALAGSFLANGHPTTVWNRTEGKGDVIVERGAVRADTVADAAAASPLVVVCVLDYDTVRAILGPVAETLKGKTLVNLTADTPERARELAGWATEHGVEYLDGSIMTPAATIGTPAAQVFYSGDPAIFEAHRPVLSSIGGRAVHLGAEPGRAAAYDVALLDLFWTTMSGYVHALALARAQGLAAGDLSPYALGIVDLMRDIIPAFADQVDNADHPGDASNIISAAAGMDHVIHSSAAQHLDVGVLSAARAIARRAIEAGHGTDGFTRLVDVLGDPAHGG